MIAMERQEETGSTSPRVTARGHLALLDWERPSELDWERPSEEETPMTSLNTQAEPVRHTPFDRIFNGGLILLVITTVGAVYACMAHL